MAEPDATAYAGWVSLLREDSDYLRQAQAPAYWSLAPYYVGQFTGSACSVASAAMVINAARAGLRRGGGIKPARQQAVLDAVGSAAWRSEVERDEGRGASLRELAEFIAAGLRSLGAAPATVTAVPLTQRTPASQAAFRDMLHAAEAAHGAWIIANYHMETVIGSGDYGHFSPVGAYDAARDRALILDVYRQELEPYWLPVDKLLAGMTIPSRSDGEPRGYLLVRLPPP